MTKTRFFRNLTDSLSLDNTTYQFDKHRLLRQNFYMLLNKTAQMFAYRNLPPTLPALAIEHLLQLYGSCVVWRVPDAYDPIGYGPMFSYSSLVTRQSSDQPSLYAFTYSLADAPDPYDEPYRVIITSPGFRPTISETLDLNSDCVLMRNDTYMRGLRWLHEKYAYLLAEAEISLRSTLVCLRDQLTFVAKTEPQRAAVSKYIQDREDGVFGSILAPDLGQPLEAIPNDSRTNAVELAVNGRQAIYAAWFNEIGLNPSFSLKREYTSAQEIDTNIDLLQPVIDDMYECRVRAVESINAMFGTSIVVEKSSAWKVKDIQVDAAIALDEAEVSVTESEAELNDAQASLADTQSDMLEQDPESLVTRQSDDSGGDSDDPV